jgi:hypothetical protein
VRDLFSNWHSSLSRVILLRAIRALQACIRSLRTTDSIGPPRVHRGAPVQRLSVRLNVLTLKSARVRSINNAEWEKFATAHINAYFAPDFVRLSSVFACAWREWHERPGFLPVFLLGPCQLT